MQEYSGQHQKTPINRRTSIHQAETKEFLESVAKKAYERNDHWGECVRIIIQCIGDLIAAKAVYHHECQVRFHACKSAQGHGYNKGRPKGCVDSEKVGAYSKLCEHVDTCDEYQFSLRQLEDLLASLQSSKEAGYSSKHLKNKLCEHYGKDMIITSQLGKETIYTFLDAGNSILRASYEDSGLFKESIVDMAAMIGCVAMFPGSYVPRVLCSPAPMFPGSDVPPSYVPQYLCSPALMNPRPMFPGTYVPPSYVPRYLCSPVPMFPGTYVPPYLCSLVSLCSMYLCSPVPMLQRFTSTYVAQ